MPIKSISPIKPILLAAVLFFAACGEKSLTSYVNPLVGTDGHGHTFPGAIVPFGMIQPSPDTRLEGWDGCSGYHYSDDTIYGFSHTHLSGTGCSDYGDVLLMPLNFSEMRELRFGSDMRDGYKHHFSHKNEIAKAGYYQVKLDTDDHPSTTVELTSDRRVAYHRYTYAEEEGNGFVIDLRHRDVLLDGSIRLTDDGLIVGHRHSSAWNPDQHLFFAIRSNIPCKRIVLSDDSTQARVEMPAARQVELQVTISGVDIKGAINNLNAAEYKTFDEARKGADSTWEAALGKIRVKDGTREQRRCFYTALYHCMTSPYLWSDVDGRYRGTDGRIHVADEGREVYTVFSLWDTYRALHPLLTEIEPERTVDFVYTAMKNFEQGGELPMWELASHETHCMIGYHAVPMILTAYVHLAEEDGTLAGYTPRQLLDAMVTTSNRTEAHRAYGAQGYLSSELDNESASKTLEYAYDDWCIAQMAEIAGDTATARTYWIRSQSWQNIIDPDGFAHPKRNGGWVTPFDPTEVNNHFTEANSWQYSTYVPHDLPGWEIHLGGADKAIALLDSLFEGHNSMSGRDQADVTGLIGMYAHGNEPSHHAAFLYHRFGLPERTNHYVHRILDEMYSSKPDGLCGNDDCGQMSAWYVLASLGMYQLCPGDGQWTLFEPIFHDVETDYFDYEDGNAAKVRPLYPTVPDSLRITPCPVFDDWRMQSDRDKVTDSVAVIDGRLPSPTVRHTEVRIQTDKKVTYLTQPAPQYTENGPEGLVDNICGSANYRIGGWQGWQGDMVADIDLLRPRPVSRVGLVCLQDMNSWIFFPRAVEASLSDDGQHFTPWQRLENDGRQFPYDLKHLHETDLHEWVLNGKRTTARYIRLRAINYGTLPDWHISAGQQAWLFVTELKVE